MCGIIGKINFNKKNPIDGANIESMLDAIHHRGPDAKGTKLFESIGLGHSRLAIIDLSEKGREPMSDSEEKIWLTFNGEIYNFQKLRKDLEKDGVDFYSETDAEVIIYLYKKYGTACVKYLEGMFAFAIWDVEKESLFLARDRVGQKPLKYYSDENTFIFASELKAILTNPEVKKEIDYSAIDEYLTYQYVPHPKTGFKNIYKLEPGHFMTVNSKGEVKKQSYWDLEYIPKEKHSEEEWKKEVSDKLKESVEKRLMSDVPLGAHLSGGIDSSLIVALMAESQSKPIETFSIGFEEDTHNELPWAKKVADQYHTSHHEFIVKPSAIELLPELAYHYEEPYADPSAIPTWYLSKLTREHVTVALNGDGGDENFLGYSRYTMMKDYYSLAKIARYIPQRKNLSKATNALYNKTHLNVIRKGGTFLDKFTDDPAEFYTHLMARFSESEKSQIYTDELYEKTKSSRARTFVSDLFTKSKNLDKQDQLLYVDLHSYLTDNLLVKVDIASMAHGLEIRSPFLDHGFMELVAKMPSEYKLRGKNKKYLLKQIAYNYLPKECIDRPKQGFGVPLEKWFRFELKDYLKEELLDEKFYAYGFRKSAIEKMIEANTDGTKKYTNQLWTLLMLRNWLRTWFEEN
jgi:asparagine synthase (glutamine-hydrolysing)